MCCGKKNNYIPAVKQVEIKKIVKTIPLKDIAYQPVVKKTAIKNDQTEHNNSGTNGANG